jgi:hypothetical protein
VHLKVISATNYIIRIIPWCSRETTSNNYGLKVTAAIS